MVLARMLWTHHVLAECDAIRVNELDHIPDGLVEGLQQFPHLLIQMGKLPVSIRQETNHRAQGSPLQQLVTCMSAGAADRKLWKERTERVARQYFT